VAFRSWAVNLDNTHTETDNNRLTLWFNLWPFNCASFYYVLFHEAILAMNCWYNYAFTTCCVLCEASWPWLFTSWPHELQVPCRTCTPNLSFLWQCHFSYWVRSTHGNTRQTDGQTDRLKVQCGLLVEGSHNVMYTV